jgi:rhodanese-related sulfurtransferase
MEVIVINPLEAFAELDADATATYVDVRVVAEFAVRHPKITKVANVPFVFFHPTTKETHPNDSFLLVMNDIFAKDSRIVLGADDGPRAEEAAQALIADGFTNLVAMSQGHAGWAKFNLATTADNRPGTSYVSLLTPAKRRK